MTEGLRALLTATVDYAGLFPPAGLPLEPAFRNYVRYRQEAEAWLLGRFVCPAAKLRELAAFRDDLQQGPPFAFSILATNDSDQLARDVDTIAAFQRSSAGRIQVDSVELKATGTAGDLDRVSKLAGGLGQVYVEIAPGPGWQVVQRLSTSATRLGFKLRCGGLEASSFPTSEQIAFAIVVCRDAGVPLKFTAGLHHPLRHFDAGVQTTMHGFLNVFVAGVLAHVRRLSAAQVCQVLDDEQAASFGFNDAGLRWHDQRATIEEIAAARKRITSFGSCSFDEPRDDLRALGLL